MVGLHEKSIEFIYSVLLDSLHTTNGFTYNTSEPKRKRAIIRLKVRLCGARSNRPRLRLDLVHPKKHTITYTYHGEKGTFLWCTVTIEIRKTDSIL